MEIGMLRRKDKCLQEEKFSLWHISLKIYYVYGKVHKLVM